MKWLERAILVAGCATLAYLIWRFNPAEVFDQISLFGMGFAVILPLQFCDNSLNAMGWRAAFRPEDARAVPFYKLFLGRVAGDGVNYLTPSGTVAGELIRPSMLGDLRPGPVKNASVFTAKFAQAMAQMAFIFIGILAVLNGPLDFLTRRERALAAGFALLALCVLGGALYLAASGSSFFDFGPWKAMKTEIRGYLSKHPWRFAQSMLWFGAAYAWGSVEGFLICRFLGMGISPLTALAIEVLSNAVDSVFFLVPAKIGTQEAGKTAIFHWLGYPASQGLAFGIIRHIRELVWAGAGFAIYTVKRRSAAFRTQAPPPTRKEPLVPAD